MSRLLVLIASHRLHCIVLALIIILCLAFDLDHILWLYPCHRSSFVSQRAAAAVRVHHALLGHRQNVSDHGRHQHMLVDGPNCHMTEWPLFDVETGPLYRPSSSRPIECRASSNIIIERRNSTAIYIPQVDRLKLRCYAQEVRRAPHDDDQYVLGRDRIGPLGMLSQFPAWAAVRVSCFKRMRTVTSTLLWTLAEAKVVALVPVRTPRLVARKSKAPKLNVLVLGIDSISWLNFRRHFPKTQSFFTRHQFTPMYGFNKVGDNTFPNLVGVLTGRHYLDFWNETIGREMKFDQLQTIWKDYARAGYLTTLIEDMPSFSVFNYNRGGFSHQPTDYYLRPVSIMIDEDKNHRFCYKNQLTMQYYYDYILDQMRAFAGRGQQPFLTIAHLADLTHNLHLNAGHADRPLEHLLGNIFAERLNTNTVIIVFSDHGIRFGRLRRTASGSFEERLPFAYIYVPENQQIAGLEPGQVRQVLAGNSHRLTCHFDLHATMLHLLNGRDPQGEPFGRSWLTSIDNNRSCEAAGIAPNWCLCSGYVSLAADSALGHQLGQLVVDNINQQLAEHSTRCAPMSLAKVEQLKVDKFGTTTDTAHGAREKRMFVVRARMSPGGGLVEATLQTLWTPVEGGDRRLQAEQIDSHRGEQFGTPEAIEVVGDISRLDRYGPQAWCIHNAIVEKFCYCNRSPNSLEAMKL